MKEIDCLRLDFQLDPALNLPHFSIAVIGQGRTQVIQRAAWIIQRIGMQPFHRQWMSAPDESVFANTPDDGEDYDDQSEYAED